MNAGDKELAEALIDANKCYTRANIDNAVDAPSLVFSQERYADAVLEAAGAGSRILNEFSRLSDVSDLLMKVNDKLTSKYDEVVKEADASLKRIEVLEVALQFYADEANHISHDHTLATKVESDRGQIARDVLKVPK